jgi:hypothetical protein
MNDWPTIRIDVDDERPATDEEVEYCEHCGAAVLEGELLRYLGERRCRECCYLCAECLEDFVDENGEFCKICASSRGKEKTCNL